MTKIMLVEDDKSLREIYGVRLLAEGYDIVSAGDGEKALAMAIKERPQLIISDVMMPKISGFDMLDILRSTTETKGIKVIMMTALSSEDQRSRGEQLGADRYLVKSQVGIEDVVRVVHEVLGDAPTKSGVPKPATHAAQASAATTVAAAPDTARKATQPVAPAPKPAQTVPRPASLGERVIQPLANNPRKEEPNMGALLDRELAEQQQATTQAQQVTPAMPTPGVSQPTSTPPPQSSPAPTAPPTQPQGDITAELDKLLAKQNAPNPTATTPSATPNAAPQSSPVQPPQNMTPPVQSPPSRDTPLAPPPAR
jgi:CheY-like chemotaxis protein